MQERALQTPAHVLIITRDDVVRNLLEQVFIIRGIPIVIAASAPGAKAIVDLWGLSAFGLVIIDTAALGARESDQQHAVCRMLGEWTVANSRLSFILLGTLFQKHALHRFQAPVVHVLVKPFRLDELVDTIDELYGGKRSPGPSLPCGS